MRLLQGAVTELRRFRAEQRVAAGRKLAGRLAGRLTAARWPRTSSTWPALAGVDAARGPARRRRRGDLPGGSRMLLDLTGAIDVAAERGRWERDLATAPQGAGGDGRQARQRAVHGQGARTRWWRRAAARLAAAEAEIARLTGAARRAAAGVTGPVEPGRRAGPGRGGARRPRRRAGWCPTGRPDRRRCSTCWGRRSARTPSIHVTGTNGKTSTARMVDALLRAFGLRTGPLHQPAPGVGRRADRARRRADRRRSACPRPTTRSRPTLELVDAARRATRSPTSSW